MFSSVEVFLRELSELTEEFFPDGRLETVYARLETVSLRLVIKPSLFIDIYFNVPNSRFDFTLIEGGKRIFGYDNLNRWHYHPLSNPEEHVECDSPSLKHIVRETASVIAAYHRRSKMRPKSRVYK